jgi:cation transport regulator ChaB
MPLIVMIGLLTASALNAGEEPILKFDVKRAKDIALAAIREKYPELSEDNLSFKGWSADSKTNAPPTVLVSYFLDKPTMRVEKDDEKRRDTESKQQTIDVVLTANGEVKNVSKGQQMVFESTSKVKPKGQQPPP